VPGMGLQFNFNVEDRVAERERSTTPLPELRLMSSFSQMNSLFNQKGGRLEPNDLPSPSKQNAYKQDSPLSATRFKKKHLKHKSSLQGEDDKPQGSIFQRADSRDKIDLYSNRTINGGENNTSPYLLSNNLPYFDTDMMQNFDVYFPYNNSEVIIMYFENKRERKVMEKKTQERRKQRSSKKDSKVYSINIISDGETLKEGKDNQEIRRKSVEARQNFNLSGYSQSLIEREQFEKFNKMLEVTSARRKSNKPGASPLKKRIKTHSKNEFF
jgi:hypothetical protein